MLAGSLEIQLSAGIARLQKDMDDAKRVVGGAMSSIDRSIGLAKTALGALAGGLAAGFSVAGLVSVAGRAIDAADAMNDLSQRTGIAVRDLAKYELATAQSGATMEALSKGIKGLGSNLLENGAALGKLGINAKDVDGAMRQVADIFQKLPDGMEKTELATKLFGKSGMELIPMLNMGSKGLDDAADKSAKYATQMAAMAPLADAYNDNMAEIAIHSKTAGMSLMNDLLPGLLNVTKATADAAKEGGILKGIWEGVQTLFGGDDLHKANVKTVESMDVLLGLENALSKAQAEGDAARVVRLTQRVAAQKEELALHQNYRTMLEGEREQAAADKPKPDAVAAAQAQAKAIRDALGGDNAKKVSEYQRMAQEITKTIELMDAEIAAGRKLSDLERYRLDTLGKLSTAHKDGKLTTAEFTKATDLAMKAVAKKEAIEEGTKAIQRNTQANKDFVEFQDEVNAAVVAESKAREQGRLAVDAYAQGIEEQNAQTTFELSLVGQTVAARQVALEQYRIELELKKQIKAIDENAGFDEVQRIEQRAKASAAAVSAIANVTNKVQVEQSQKTADQMENLYTDALFRAAESGKGFFASLGDTIVNTFKTMVLRPVVSAIVNPVAGAAASLLGFSGTANAAGGAASGLSGLSAAGGLAGFGSTLGSSLASSFGASISGNLIGGLGGAIEGGLAAIGTGTSSAIAGGLGQIAGALGPYALAAVAIAGLFGAFRGEYVKGAGSATTAFDGMGKTTATNQFGNSFDFQTAEADKYVASLQSGYNNSARALGIKNQGGAFAFGSNNSDGGKFGVNASVGTARYASTDIKITPEALALEASRAVFAALQGSELPAYMAKVFDSITASSATAEQINQALAYAGSLKQVRDALTETRTPLQALKETLGTTLASLGTDAANFKTAFVSAIDAGIGPDALAQWQAAGTSMAALADEAKKLADTNANLQDKLDVLTGTQTARTLELRSATEDSTRALLNQIYAQEDLKTATDAAAKAAEDAARVAEQASWNAYQDWLDRQKAAADQNLDLQGRLDLATGKSTARQVSLQKELAGALDGANAALIRQVYAQEDIATARTTVDDLRNQATQQYLTAQQAVTTAQQAVANALHNTIKTFQDVIDSLEGNGNPLQSLAGSRAKFHDLSAAAGRGDATALAALPKAAKDFLDLSKGFSSSRVDYQRDQAVVRNTLNTFISQGGELLKKLPADMQQASDPLKDAYTQLAKATAAEEKARTVAIAIKASLTDTEKDLGKKYLEAIQALPEGEALKAFYDTTLSAADAAAAIAQASAASAVAMLATLQQAVGTVAAAVASSALAVSGQDYSGQGGGPSSDSTTVGYDEYMATVGYTGSGQGGNSADLFKSGQARIYTSAGVQYGTTAGIAQYLNDRAALVGKDNAITEAAYYGITGAGLDVLRKAVPQASFAVGTNFVPQDMLAQVHKGEVIIPAPFNPERFGAASGNDSLVAEIRALRAEVKQLREDNSRENNAIIAPTNKTARLIERVMPAGDALQTRAIA